MDAARIEEVINDFVTLKKRGANLLGLCPFHNEKTPSFNVSPSKGIFKCFGCGKAGNVIRFIMEHEHLSYPEALRYLARKYHIPVEEQEETPEQKEAQNERESMMAVTAFAVQYFADNLMNTEPGKAVGLTYFQERGFTTDTIKKFQLGYAADSWDDFTRHARAQGFQDIYLEKTGLTVVNQDQRFDRFRSRVMFPIHSLSGRVIGFGGRTIGKDPSKAKYINSPESEIYHKSSTLYGIFFARNAIASKDECYLTEGYTDVISLHQAGFTNVVASSGTSLTVDQIKLIKRFTQNITILYDGDEAGIKASFRGIDMILEQGMNVKVVLFPEGEDPDSFVRKNRLADVTEFLQKNARNFILFKANLLQAESACDPIKRTQLIREIVSSIALIPDAITRNEYIRDCSALLNVGEQSLINELNKTIRKHFNQRALERTAETLAEMPEPKVIPDFQSDIDTTITEYQERDIIRLLILYGDNLINLVNPENPSSEVSVRVAEFIVNDLLKDDITFNNPVLQIIFNHFADALEKGSIPKESTFLGNKDEAISRMAIDLVSSPYALSRNWKEKKKIYVPTEEERLILPYAVTSSVLSLKLKKLERMILDNQKEIKAVTREEDLVLLLQKQRHLSEIKKIISSHLGRIVTH